MSLLCRLVRNSQNAQFMVVTFKSNLVHRAINHCRMYEVINHGKVSRMARVNMKEALARFNQYDSEMQDKKMKKIKAHHKRNEDDNDGRDQNERKEDNFRERIDSNQSERLENNNDKRENSLNGGLETRQRKRRVRTYDI